MKRIRLLHIIPHQPPRQFQPVIEHKPELDVFRKQQIGIFDQINRDQQKAQPD